jgi:hypothetical protein
MELLVFGIPEHSRVYRLTFEFYYLSVPTEQTVKSLQMIGAINPRRNSLREAI